MIHVNPDLCSHTCRSFHRMFNPPFFLMPWKYFIFFGTVPSISNTVTRFNVLLGMDPFIVFFSPLNLLQGHLFSNLLQKQSKLPHWSEHSGSNSSGGCSQLRHTGMCHPNGLLFHKKSLDIGPIVYKKSLQEDPNSQKQQKKLVKSAVFELEKPLEMGPDLQKLKKKRGESNQLFFDREKSLGMGRDFRPRTLHTPSKNNLRILLPQFNLYWEKKW